MKQRVIQLLFGSSLLLTFTATILFVRSFWWHDQVAFERYRDEPGGRERRDALFFSVHNSTSSMYWRVARHGRTDRRLSVWWRELAFGVRYARTSYETSPFQLLWHDQGPLWHRLGFAFKSEREALGSPFDETVTVRVSAPSWFIVLIMSLASALFFVMLRRDRRRRRRRAAGLCPACAYDLRGGPHGRCPECGEAVAAPMTV